MSMWQDIEAFHQKFHIPQEETPGFPASEMMAFRLKFLKEELEEFEEAYEKNDLVLAFDALLDLAYVVLGTAYIMNLPWDKAWAHVQMSNMEKMRALKESDSTRGSTFDVVKPEGWISPNNRIHAEILMHEYVCMWQIFKKANLKPTVSGGVS